MERTQKSNKTTLRQAHLSRWTNPSLFDLPVQANGADDFKLALYHISSGLEGVDARIVHTQHDQIIVKVRDGIEDQVEAIVKESMEEAFRQIIAVPPFVSDVRVLVLMVEVKRSLRMTHYGSYIVSRKDQTETPFIPLFIHESPSLEKTRRTSPQTRQRA